jgi:hypothetical protein
LPGLVGGENRGLAAFMFGTAHGAAEFESSIPPVTT